MRQKIEVPAGRARRVPRPRRSRGRMRAGQDPRSDLPPDAHGRQAGDGAQLRRAAAAPATARARRGSMAARSSCRPARCSASTRWRRRPRATIHSVRMTTRKPPNGLAGAPLSRQATASRSTGSTTAKLVFSGTAREAAAGFPANVNVVAALVARRHRPGPHHDRHLGGPGDDAELSRRSRSTRTSATFSLSIENIPSENPKTGPITALSVIARCASSTRRCGSGRRKTARPATRFPSPSSGREGWGLADLKKESTPPRPPRRRGGRSTYTATRKLDALAIFQASWKRRSSQSPESSSPGLRVG